jgi:hypothetical protein
MLANEGLILNLDVRARPRVGAIPRVFGGPSSVVNVPTWQEVSDIDWDLLKLESGLVVTWRLLAWVELVHDRFKD